LTASNDPLRKAEEGGVASKNAIASETDDAVRRKSADSEMNGSEVHAAGMDNSARRRYELR
jgi:hypothetical protein